MEKLIAKVQEDKTVLLCLMCFIMGLALGFIISPVKNGIAIGSYNGSNNNVKDTGCNNSVKDSNKTKKVVDSKITDKL